MDTSFPGGVTDITFEEVAAMQDGQYILHARGGKLTKVPVEKSRLPHDPQGHLQCVNTALGPDGVIYVNQISITCKSTDGGRTWTSHERDWPGGELAGWLRGEGGNPEFNVLSDGTFIAVTRTGRRSEPMDVWGSSDEARSWQKISQIELPVHDSRDSYTLFRLPDDTLLYGVAPRQGDYHEGTLAPISLLVYRSTDKGKSWQGPSKICDWGLEGGIAQMASGKLLSVVRYQCNPDPEAPGKVIFLVDSDDEGRTWGNFRQLTTIHGQCYGYPAALSDGTVVIVHDSRYGPSPASYTGSDVRRFDQGRAMISYDEGETWEDEVYYMFKGKVLSGYTQSVVLEDDVILTIAGTSDNEAGADSWQACMGQSDLMAIRWKPESKG